MNVTNARTVTNFLLTPVNCRNGKERGGQDGMGVTLLEAFRCEKSGHKEHKVHSTFEETYVTMEASQSKMPKRQIRA